MNRVCRICGFEFDISLFPITKNRLGKKYHLNLCRFCISKQKRKNNKEIAERQKKSDLESFRERERKRSKKWRESHKTEHYVHKLLERSIKEGFIIKPNECSECGVSGVKINGHHEDYGKPYEVIWLCDICHKKRHVEIKKLDLGFKTDQLAIEHKPENLAAEAVNE